jgi:hypothetical protein
MRWTTCDRRVDGAEEVASAVDEQRIAELFRAAAGEPPPPSFGSDDVIAAARRASARRRTAVAGGTLLGVAVLAGGVLAGGQLLPAGTPSAGQAAPQAGVPSPGDVHPFALPEPGPRSLPVGGAQASCGPVDATLAGELTALLAERHIGLDGPAGPVPEACPPGSRAVAVPVPGGTLEALVVPVAGQGEPVDITRPDGGRGYAVTLADGRGVTVISLPGVPGEQPPFAGQVPDLVRALAARL